MGKKKKKTLRRIVALNTSLTHFLWVCILLTCLFRFAPLQMSLLWGLLWDSLLRESPVHPETMVLLVSPTLGCVCCFLLREWTTGSVIIMCVYLSGSEIDVGVFLAGKCITPLHSLWYNTIQLWDMPLFFFFYSGCCWWWGYCSAAGLASSSAGGCIRPLWETNQPLTSPSPGTLSPHQVLWELGKKKVKPQL